MAVWGSTPGDLDGPDYRIARDGLVAKYWRPSILNKTALWLLDHGYFIARVSADRWTSEEDMHGDLASALDFPAYYGENLSALVDCMRDVADQQYGLTPRDTGLAIVIERYDAFAVTHPRVAHHLVDILVSAARDAALYGNRILCLIQSDDPDLEIAPVAATHVFWNSAEWEESTRRST